MKEIKFDLLEQEFIELNKLLKLLGLAENGGEAKAKIEQGLVQVNQNTELQKRKKLREGDEVLFANHRIVIIQGD